MNADEILKPNTDGWTEEYWDPWTALGLSCASYNSAIDDQAIAVLKALYNDGEFAYCNDIAKRTGLTPEHVELFQYMFCSAGWCEYGVSPRGCWPIDREGFPRIIAAWEDFLIKDHELGEKR